MQLQRYQLAIILLIGVLFSPAVVSGLTHEPIANDAVNGDSVENSSITFISTQGKEISPGPGGRAVAVRTDSDKTVWSHNKYGGYFDIDPIDDERVLLAALANPQTTYALVVNWRTGETVRRFEIPQGTHDIDYLGDHRYAIADISNHRAYVYNASAEHVVWEFDFTEQFPPTAGGGPDGDYSGDYTHLNDIDAIDNGSAFLVSPRNFDRVMLINRSTKTVEWTLGEEDDYSILYEQHNPVLLEQNPPTVLVADSENDRVIEYQRNGSEWTPVWGYTENLRWPRDADRLPNGNTLIVDTSSNRVLEVTPNGSVVWQYPIQKHPYDVERLEYGDEPTGPPMTAFQSEFDKEEILSEERGIVASLEAHANSVYDLSQWLLPWWVSKLDLYLLIAAIGVALLWGRFEISRGTKSMIPRRLEDRTALLQPAVTIMLCGAGIVSLYFGVAPSTDLQAAIPFVNMNISTLDPVLLGVGLLSVLQLSSRINWSRLPNGEAVGKLATTLLVGACLLLALKSFQLSQQNIVGKTHYYDITVLLLSGVWYTVRSLISERPALTYIISFAVGVLGLTVLAKGTGFGAGPGVSLAIGSIMLLEALPGIKQYGRGDDSPLAAIAVLAGPILELLWLTLSVILLLIFVGLVGLQFGIIHLGLTILLIARYQDYTTDNDRGWPELLPERWEQTWVKLRTG